MIPPRPRRASDPPPPEPPRRDWEFDCPTCSQAIGIHAAFVPDTPPRCAFMDCPTCGADLGIGEAPDGTLFTLALDQYDDPPPEWGTQPQEPQP